MELKLNITMGQVITVLVIALLAGGIGFLLPKPETNQEINTYNGFIDKDLNILGNLAYNTGHCERIGLVSGVLPQITDNNEVYGLPICIEREVD